MMRLGHQQVHLFFCTILFKQIIMRNYSTQEVRLYMQSLKGVSPFNTTVKLEVEKKGGMIYFINIEYEV